MILTARFTTFALATTTLSIVLGCGFREFELLESHFENYESLKASQTWYGGWVPIEIPESAYDIYECHDLDTNSVRLRFSFSPEDTFYEADNFLETRRTSLPSATYLGQQSWWFSEQLLENGKIFLWVGKTWTSEDLGYWVIDLENGTAYYWNE